MDGALARNEKTAMRFEQNGISLWYGTPDAPAPEGDIHASPAGRAIGIKGTFAVQPIGARIAVELRFRVNGGGGAKAPASLARTDVRTNTQFFVAALPEFRLGDTIEYIGVASWPGGQVPAADLASTFPSSFRIVAAGAGSSARPSEPGTASTTSKSSAPAAATGAPDGKGLASLPSPRSTNPAPKRPGTDAQLAALLAASPEITSTMRARFVSLYNENQGAMAEFWEKLSKDQQLGPVVPQLQLLLQLGTLTLNNPELVAKLLTQLHPARMRDLTRLDSNQLVKIITEGKIQVPKRIADTTTPATIAQYADAMIGSLKEAFATDFVAKSLGASSDATHQAVAAFLGKSPDFDFDTAKIDTYLAEHSTAVAGMTADQTAAFVDRLKATQRTFRMTKDGETIRKLMELDLDSSYKIATMPAGNFVQKHGHDLGGEEKARQIHANATTVSALTTHIIRQAQENATTGTPWMIAGGDGGAKNALREHIPNWQTLFGSTSTCQCSECGAIDGPAAYFVGLLEFLRKLGKNVAGHTPLDILIGSPRVKGRRPDLANLKLNCANADTALPYVDLVNEIMESYVAHGEIRASTAHDTPNDAMPQALGINPENLQSPDAIKAYEILSEASIVYPFTLPFDRSLQTARNYLRFLGLSRYQLLQSFGVSGNQVPAGSPATIQLLQAIQLAAEALLISEPEYILITNQTFSGQAPKSLRDLSHYFGFSAEATWQNKIEKVPEFLKRTGLTFGDLLALLGTQYLNPNHLDPKKAISLPLTPGTDPCNVAAMHIADVGEFLPPLPAFLRLWRKLGWQIPELDYALRAFGQTPGRTTGDKSRPISKEFILIAAKLKQLQATLNLSVSQTVSLWKDVDTDGRTSLFMSLFQNKAVTNPPDLGLRLLYQAPLARAPRAPLPTHWSDGAAQDLAFYRHSSLQFIGSMTDRQRDELLQWAGTDEDAILAVQSLYGQRWYHGIQLAGTQGESQIDFISSHINTILAALRISASDLLAIAQDAGYSPTSAGDWGELNIASLSTCYRYVLIAQSLGLSVPDLITLKNLTGLQPFQTCSGADCPHTDPVIQFVAAAQQVAASKFSIAQLAYLFLGNTDPASVLAPLQATQDAVVSAILVGLQNIAAANAFAPDPTGATLRKKLAVLLPSALQLDATIGLIGGSAIYASVLANLPTGVTLPSGQVSYVVTLTIAGTITAQDALSLTMSSNAVASSPVTVSYLIQTSDTLSTVAAGLAAQINGDHALATVGISATVAGPVISLSAPPSLSPGPVWTVSSSPSTASETATLGGNLVCNGPMNDATATALGALSTEPGFNNAVQDLYNQAQDVLTENLGFLVPSGPYSAALPTLPAGVTVLPDQVSFIATATIGGTTTAKDTLSVTMTSSAVTGSPVTVTYSVQKSDTLDNVAAGLAAQINANPALAAAAISAAVSGPVISLSTPATLSPTPVWTVTANPTGASETLTFGGNLVSIGPMRLSTKTDLLMSSQNPAFTAALESLYDQAWGSVIANLIDAPSSSAPADRFNYVLDGLLEYLTNTQSRSLVKQNIAQALGLDPNVVDLLLDGNTSLGWPQGLLPSSINPALSAMSDLLGGLSATSYSTAMPSSVQATRIDPGIAFDGTEPSFGSVQWTGKLLAPKTGAYRFAVPVSSSSTSAAAAPQITLLVGGQSATPLSGGASNPVNLTAGQIYDISLSISAVPPSTAIALQWCLAPSPLATLTTVPALALMPCRIDGSYATLSLLYRIAVLVNGFSMSASELAYLSTRGQDFAGVDPISANSVPFSLAGLPAAGSSDAPALFNQWQRLNALYTLKASLPIGNVTLFDVFRLGAGSPSISASGTPASLPALIQQATGWNLSDIETFVGSNGFGLPNSDFRNEIPLVQLATCTSICSRIGVSAQKLFAWTNLTQAAQCAGVAQDIQNTVKAKYDDATWLTVGKPLNDKLRESSKEALIAYILNQTGYTDAKDLYAFFLIDVEMCTCMETSRLVQASAAVQLFVQRCLLNLENDTGHPELDIKPSVFSAEDVEEWTQWRKNYRLWQAAVEVFLYPENWIIPELRPNKTPFFENLETALLQSDVTAGNAEAAFLAYLASLQQVTRLEIAGLCTDDDSEAGSRITHVIGRTFTSPHIYFYRTLDIGSYVWSPWEKIDADISGDSLIPVLWNRRLFLFWPLYTEVTDPTDPNQNGSTPPSIKSQPESSGSSSTTISQPPPALKTLQLQLAWSEYKNGQWTSKQITADPLIPTEFTGYSTKLDTSAFVYTAIPGAESQDELVVTAYAIFDSHSTYLNTAVVQTEMATAQVNQLVSIGNSALLLGYGNGNINFNVGSWTPDTIAQALQAAATAITMFASVVQTDKADRNVVANAANNINQALNTLSSSSQLHPSDMQNVLNLILQAQQILTALKNAQPYTLETLGSFTFDGAQGSVEIDLTPKVDSNQLHQFPMVADLYRSRTGQTAREFLYQNVYREDAGLSLAVSGHSGHPAPAKGKPHRHSGFPTGRVGPYPSGTFWPFLKTSTLPKPNEPAPDSVILLASSKPISSFEISFPEERIPDYSIDLSTDTFKKIAFFSDRRRTYLMVSSLPTVATQIKHEKHADLSSHVTPESFYFFNHYHPWVGQFLKRVNWKGIPYLLDPRTQALDSAHPEPGQDSKFEFVSHYGPSRVVAKPYPKESIDFSQMSPDLKKALAEEKHRPFVVPAGDSAYSIYNWEIFFYIPLFIATRLSQNQQFAEAQNWFHYIFNPTQDPERKGVPSDYDRGTPNGYWNFQPLNKLHKDGGLQDILDSVRGPANAALNAQWNAWTNAPFEPDVIARLRLAAYQKTVVMKYLDNLIKWGDYLFRQNTRESINEAIQIFILADQILGDKPVTLPELGTVLDQTYSELVKDKLNKMGNAQVQLENAFPFTVSGKVSKKRATGSSVLSTIISTPYFCTPANPTLLGYYDTVADRLYKIRHCMNIQGQVEQLPLFAPPINPALLVAAAAAGVDLSSVLNDINAAVPHYRFTYMLSKALELCTEVRSLGGALLAALEKYDAEGLALLRAGQELSVLRAVRQVKQLQIQEANANLSGLQATQAVTIARQTYYQGLVQGGLSGYETGQMVALAISEFFKQGSEFGEIAAAALAIIPQYTVGINGVFGSPCVNLSFGGQQLSDAARAAAGTFASQAEAASFVASMLGMMGGWDRRAAEWAFQLETASLELAQIQQQINAANFRIQIATQDLNNQELQIANASAVQSALKSKFTNRELYSWMVNQVSTFFFQCYQMTYDLAKRSETCFRFEVGLQQSSYIKFGYWDSAKKGLLAGEKLFQDLKSLEGAYLDQNRREYEISKSISFLQLDPFALISLKLTGQCLINLPEAYFDMDYPGHYMRRIKSVGLTLPCVTGPYTNVNCTLTLLQSKIRVDSKLTNASSYPEKPIASDGRFSYNFAATESIATSTAQNDSGMFEVNFRDERYLPFEGSGVISQWQLSMPSDCNAFDFETITDVILNLKYTARPGGDALQAAAKSTAALPARTAQSFSQTGPQSPPQSNLQRGFSLRHEYPTEWYKFVQPRSTAPGASPIASMQINLSNGRFPFQFRSKSIKITKADLFVIFDDSSASALQPFSLFAPNVSNFTPSPIQLSPASPVGNTPHFSTSNPPAPSSATQGGPISWTLQYGGDLSQLPIADIFLICEFSVN
jgi:Tc toxin complex TcA C-terminal TcB-binding domain/Neuraminidase-like domain/Salmonella virulence plasmid 28.1kDa A protein